MAKKVKMPGRVESVEVGGIVTGAGEILDDEKGKKQSVINSEVEAELVRLENEKQDNITVDSVPMEGSDNPVSSGAVYTADKALSDAIEAILLLIPSAASALNQLADKKFVQDSVATSTATFRGTYNVVSDLHLSENASHAQIEAALDALSLGADTNDYCFVQVPDNESTENIKKTERYKFNGDNWAYEYDLNNSGFTAAQWEAINSNITALLVTKLSQLPTNEVLTALLAAKQDNLTFDDEPTAGSINPVTSGGIYTRNNEIVAMITALEAAKQDNLTFDSVPVNGSENPVTSGGVYDAIYLVQVALAGLDGRMLSAEHSIEVLTENVGILRTLYQALNQSDIIVGAKPTTGVANIIYRVPGSSTFADWMYYNGAWVKLAEYTTLDGYLYKGIATPNGSPAASAVKMFYFALIAGTYTNFGNLVVTEGISILKYDGANWTQDKLYYGDGGVFDISKYNLTNGQPTPYPDLEAALGSNGDNVPEPLRKGGMSVKFIQGTVQSSDNKYVQFMYLGTEITGTPNPFLDTNNWQKTNLEKELFLLNGGDFDSFTFAGFLSTEGVFTAAEGWKTTDYIPILNGESYAATVKCRENSTALIAFYDENKYFISAVVEDGSIYYSINGTVNNASVYYCRFCTKDESGASEKAKWQVLTNFTGTRNNLLGVIKGINDRGFVSVAFDKDGFVNANGEYNDTSAWKSTDFIPVIEGIQYEVRTYGQENVTSLLAFYSINDNDALISNVVAQSTGFTQVIGKVPASAFYMRVSTKATEVGSSTCKVDSLHNVGKIVGDAAVQSVNESNMVSVLFSEDGFINASGDASSTSISWKKTPKINVYEGVRYSIYTYGQSGVTSLVAFYDKDDEVVSTIVASETGKVAITGFVPQGAAYMRSCTKTTDLDGCYCKVDRSHNLEAIIIQDITPAVGYKYGHNLQRPYDFTDKRFICFGDSITAGVYSYDGGMSETYNDSYIRLLANKLGVTFYFDDEHHPYDNKAQGGTGFCYTPSEYPSKKKITDVILEFTGTADVIYIAGGTNDFQTNQPVGSLGDNTIATVYGALYLICEYLKTNYPNAIVIFATPINMARTGFLHGMNEYRNAIFEMATKYGYNVVDCSKFAFPDYDESVDNPDFKELMLYDGVHPTLLGHKYMADNIASILL